MKVMIDSTQEEQAVQRNSFQENTNWAAFGLDPITATVSNINTDAEAQPDADSRQDVEKSVSAWICVLGSFLTLIPTFGRSTTPTAEQ
jgi:hypothetical protein